MNFTDNVPIPGLAGCGSIPMIKKKPC